MAVLAAVLAAPAYSQTNEWAWMSGPSGQDPNVNGSAVTNGEYLFAAGNVPGGRLQAVGWTGSDGRLWLFGGYGMDTAGLSGELNDLWVFDPAQGSHGEWAWVGGSVVAPNELYGGQPGVYGAEYQFSGSNIPGGRLSPSARMAKGKVWVFGGTGIDAANQLGTLNDLWAFDPAQGAHGEWAWMAGSSQIPSYCTRDEVYCGEPGHYGTEYEFSDSNTPGGRTNATLWTDPEGHLWLYGGYGQDANGTRGDLNDLWEFDPDKGAHGQWAWMGGSSAFAAGCTNDKPCSQPAKYGAKYQFAADNQPGARWATSAWTDKSGKLWLFSAWDDNDLWEFDPQRGPHGEWAWVGGASTPSKCWGGICGDPGIFDREYALNPRNTPGTHGIAFNWTGSDGSFWIYGGQGFAAPIQSEWGAVSQLDDLWVFDPTQGTHGLWGWMGGSYHVDVAGVYTAKYKFAPTNFPGNRNWGVGWSDKDGNIWLFGGEYTAHWGNSSTTISANDLWEFKPLRIQTIHWTPPESPVTYGVQPIELSSTASTGLPVVFSVLSGPGTVSGNNGSTLTITGAGTVVVAAKQAGNSTWAGDEIDATIMVNKAPQTIEFDQPATPATYGDPPEPLAATTPSGLAVAFLSDSPSVCSVQGPQVTFLAAGTCVVKATQNGNANYLSAAPVSRSITVNQAVLTISADAKTVKQGNRIPGLTWTVSGIVSGDTAAKAFSGKPVLSTTATSKSPAGLYTITVTKGTLAAANYAFTLKNGTLTVTGQVAKPVFKPAGGTYTGTQKVTISSSPGATIRYTTDGSLPTATYGTVYSGPLNVSKTTTVRAIATLAGCTPSVVATATYTIH